MTKKTKVSPTAITFVLDESGSMGSFKDEVIKAYNSYLSEVKKNALGEVITSLIKFDTRAINRVYLGRDIKEAPKLTEKTYMPGLGTPLIDALYDSILATEEVVEDFGKKKIKVVVVCQTDGYENSSTRYSNRELADLIHKKQKKDWQFVFLGADMDAFAQAGKFGINQGTTMSYGSGVTGQSVAMAAMNVANYANTGAEASLNFSDEQRAVASGEKKAKKKQAGDGGSVLVGNN
jgi:hypothetical protein